MGEWHAKEIILHCDVCSAETVYASEELQVLAPPRCKFGYDVLIHVGTAWFLGCRSEEEIQQELAQKNISISKSEIDYLAKKFIIYLAVIHRENSCELKESMALRGGYILHLDGTCEGDSPHLISVLDGLSEIVLDNVKLPSENSAQIIPFLSRIKARYGCPQAVVSDMGKGMALAIKTVFPQVPAFICHFHFLRDLGKDLLGIENDILRKHLKKYGAQSLLRKAAKELKPVLNSDPNWLHALATCMEGRDDEKPPEFLPTVYALILWVLDARHLGDGLGFPFDRSHLDFYQRLKTMHSVFSKLPTALLPINSLHQQLVSSLQKIMDDAILRKTASSMQRKIQVFDELRKAMRITLPGKKQGLNDDGEDTDINTIEKGVTDFCQGLCSDYNLAADSDLQKMIAQIDKYWDKLFADSIAVDTPNGKIIIQPQRTNNILERFFRNLKRNHCKKTGTSSMSKMLKTMLSDTPLVKNLENQQYLEMILNGRNSLEERFAEIDSNTIRKEMKNHKMQTEGIPRKLKKIITKSDFPKILLRCFS